ncbi:MAG: hypothetical protein ACLP50_08505 [Solirubrobacteraceae bacterium]
MTDQIPPILMRFGEQYEQAARRELPPGPGWPRRRTLQRAALSSTAVVAIIAAVVLIVSATTGASPAYALTQNGDGSITISLSNLTTGISQLNARLQQMGINYTVIPITQNCTTSTAVLGTAPGSLSETITIGTQNTELAGVDGYLAAEQLPNGQIGLAVGGMQAPLPTCFSSAILTTQPSPTAGSNATGTTTATTTSSSPLPLPAAVRRQLKASRSRATSLTTATTKSLPPVTHGGGESQTYATTTTTPTPASPRPNGSYATTTASP